MPDRANNSRDIVVIFVLLKFSRWVSSVQPEKALLSMFEILSLKITLLIPVFLNVSLLMSVMSLLEKSMVPVKRVQSLNKTELKLGKADANVTVKFSDSVHAGN